MADYDVVGWAGLGVLLFLALLVAPQVGRVLAPGRRQAKRVQTQHRRSGRARRCASRWFGGVRRRYVITVVNGGERPVYDVVVGCLLGPAAASVAYGNQLPFCVWRTLAPQQPPKTWTPEFTIADDDARLLSGRRPPALRL